MKGPHGMEHEFEYARQTLLVEAMRLVPHRRFLQNEVASGKKHLACELTLIRQREDNLHRAIAKLQPADDTVTVEVPPLPVNHPGADDGGPDFPTITYSEAHPPPCMTLRDWLAGMAMQGLLRHPELVPTFDRSLLAARAYRQADDMLEAGKK